MHGWVLISLIVVRVGHSFVAKLFSPPCIGAVCCTWDGYRYTCVAIRYRYRIAAEARMRWEVRCGWRSPRATGRGWQGLINPLTKGDSLSHGRTVQGGEPAGAGTGLFTDHLVSSGSAGPAKPLLKWDVVVPPW